MNIQRVKKNGAKGFTIIEIIMVIVIISVLAVLTIPRFDSFYAIKLNGAVKRVVSDIRYVQQLAISRHENYLIGFRGNSYEVRRVSDGVLATSPFTRGSLVVNFDTDLMYKGITISNLSLGGFPSMIFNWQGIPQNGVGVNLAVAGQVTFSYQGNSLTIFVEPNTGRVSVQ